MNLALSRGMDRKADVMWCLTVCAVDSETHGPNKNAKVIHHLPPSARDPLSVPRDRGHLLIAATPVSRCGFCATLGQPKAKNPTMAAEGDHAEREEMAAGGSLNSDQPISTQPGSRTASTRSSPRTRL